MSVATTVRRILSPLARPSLANIGISSMSIIAKLVQQEADVLPLTAMQVITSPVAWTFVATTRCGRCCSAAPCAADSRVNLATVAGVESFVQPAEPSKRNACLVEAWLPLG